MSFLKKVCSCCQISLSLLFLVKSVEAKSFDWPRENLARYPLITIFGPDQKDSFAYTRGVSSALKSDPDRKKFNFINLDKAWMEKRSCAVPARRSGLIHTSPYVLAINEQLRVAVPVSFKFKGEFSPTRLEQIQLWPLIKISLVKWTERDKWSTLLEQAVPVSYFVHDGSVQGHQVNINYSNIILTEPVQVAKDTDVRVRIQWSADTLCDETDFKLKIGDQIRLIRNN